MKFFYLVKILNKLNKMDIKHKIQNHKLIMFVMLWLLLAAIIVGLLIKGQFLLGVGIAPIGYQISKITINVVAK
jgi:hypothetical protein